MGVHFNPSAKRFAYDIASGFVWAPLITDLERSMSYELFKRSTTIGLEFVQFLTAAAYDTTTAHGESAPLTLSSPIDGFESEGNSLTGVGIISPSPEPKTMHGTSITYNADATTPDAVDTLPYWISVNFVVGSLLYTAGSLAWTFDHYLTPNDYDSLVTTVAFFTGGTSFGLANSMNLYRQLVSGGNRKSCCAAIKSPNCCTALILMMATSCYYTISLSDVMGFVHECGSLMWIVHEALRVMGGTGFWLGGGLGLWFSRNNADKSRLVPWCWALGGFCFFVGAFGLLSDDPTVVFWLAKLPYVAGSGLYLLGSVAGLRDWSRGQRDRGSMCDVLRRR